MVKCLYFVGFILIVILIISVVGILIFKGVNEQRIRHLHYMDTFSKKLGPDVCEHS
jgi:hypothetical protein